MMDNLPMGLFIAFLASTAYGLLFNVPHKALLWGGVAGLIGWLGYAGTPLLVGIGQPAAALCGSVCVSLAGEIMARGTKHPATVFIVPGIIPLVPGAGAYQTMLLFLQGKAEDGLRMGLDTAFFAGGVAAGILTVGSVFRAYKVNRRIRVRQQGSSG